MEKPSCRKTGVKSWSNFLNETGICQSGYGGNRPCDNGAICDRCTASWIQEEFEKWKKGG